jgi:hypothetical protein
MRNPNTTTDRPRVPACICESCCYIAPVRDFSFDAIAYAVSKGKGMPAEGLRCPRCHSARITEGEMPAPPPDQHAKLKRLVMALGLAPELKDAAIRAIDSGDAYGQELLALARKHHLRGAA